MTSAGSGRVCIDPINDTSTVDDSLPKVVYNDCICVFRDPESETVSGYNQEILLTLGISNHSWRTSVLIQVSRSNTLDPSIGVRISVCISSLSSISIHCDLIASSIMPITNDSVFPVHKSTYHSCMLIYL